MTQMSFFMKCKIKFNTWSLDVEDKFPNLSTGVFYYAIVCDRSNYVPPNLYIKDLTPTTSECDFIWKSGHCRCN